MTTPTPTAERSGRFTLGDRPVNRIGYGAMQLAGPHVMGPPADRAAAVAVLRRAVELGVDHIDTSDYYGPHVTNEIIREALHPYPEDLTIVTKVGAERTPAGEPSEALAALQEEGLIRHLGVSNVTTQQLAEAQSITTVVCVQSHYNLVHRDDDPLVDALAREGVPYVPFFPLGGFTPLQSAALETVARRLEASP